MSVTLGLISDVHADAAPLREALERLRAAGAETLLCAGDIAGYGAELEACVALLEAYDVRSVAGNHDRWYVEDTGDAVDGGGAATGYLAGLPTHRTLEVAGTRLYLVHASPPDALLEGIRLRDEQGALLPGECAAWSARLAGAPFEVLVVGHTHQLFAERLGAALVLNPGSTCFNYSCMLLTLPELAVRVVPLGGRTPRLSWHWGLERRQPRR